MCIRDRDQLARIAVSNGTDTGRRRHSPGEHLPLGPRRPSVCLLYTSDAADERSSVDLGGRRIIKNKQKKKKEEKKEERQELRDTQEKHETKKE